MSPDSAPLPAGLSSAEAAARINQYGSNQIKPAQQRAVVLQFLAHFRNPLVLVLLAASGISALTGDTTGALIIGLIVLISVSLLAGLVTSYLLLVEVGKRWFYKRLMGA